MKTGQKNSYKSLKSISINGKEYKYYSLSEAEKNGLKGISKLPKSLKVILENYFIMIRIFKKNYPAYARSCLRIHLNDNYSRRWFNNSI